MENHKINENRRKSKLNKSIDSFKEIYQRKNSIHEIINNSLQNQINNESLSLIWKIYLNIIPFESPDLWVKCLSLRRDEYYSKYNHLVEDSIIKFFNNEIKIESLDYKKDLIDMLYLIRIDIERTFQEIDLFRNKKVKETLCIILYIWTSENNDIGYIQGMNEIVGTLYYAMFPNIVSSKNIANDEETSLFYFINSEDCFDADVYMIFSELMKRGLKDLYNYNDIKFKENYKNGLLDGFEVIDNTYLTLDYINKSNTSHLKKRINIIFYYYLKIIDYELFIHIHDKVEPYLFMFRWILCILNREISISNVIYTWECIFAFEYIDSNNLSFLDFICVAMLLSMKDDLMKDDDTCFILSLLMHFPYENQIKNIIQSAINVRERIHEHLKISEEFIIVN